MRQAAAFSAAQLVEIAIQTEHLEIHAEDTK